MTLVFDSVAPAGQGCGQSRCWTRTRKGGVAYNGGQLKPDGVASLRVTPGPEGKASLAFAARGPNVDFTPVNPDQELFPGGELLVQLRAGDACWSAFYSSSGSPPDIRTNTRYRKKGHVE